MNRAVFCLSPIIVFGRSNPVEDFYLPQNVNACNTSRAYMNVSTIAE